jgi:uncharacterized protein (TIGR02646 family)
MATAAVVKTRAAIAAKVLKGEELKETDFKNHWGKVKDHLCRYQSGKCAFCEITRRPKYEFDVEHFRPKAKVTERPDHPGYWWLAYRWSNYLLSCKSCNSEYKKTHFPLLRENDRAMRPSDPLARERPVLIDPSIEDPAEYIGFDWASDSSKVIPIGTDRAGRGARTIGIFGLMIRDDLHKGRYDAIEQLRLLEEVLKSTPGPTHPMYLKAMRQLRRKLESDQPYLGTIRAYVYASSLRAFIQ